MAPTCRRCESAVSAPSESALLLRELAPATMQRLHDATAGNPLAMLELADDAERARARPRRGAAARLGADLGGVPAAGAPARRARATRSCSPPTSDSGDLALLERAAARLGIDLAALSDGESAGLVTLGADRSSFAIPLVRSAVYADAPATQRREMHRALAAALPDRDIDRRAWHLAAAAVGPDDVGLGGARAGRRPRPRPQRLRDGLGGV